MNQPTNTVKQIKSWFEQAMPAPTVDNQRVQVGVHFEEVAEMIEVLGYKDNPDQHRMLFETSHKVMTRFATHLKTNKEFALVTTDRLEMLDALCDQIVTAIGSAHTFGFDILGALQEVANSNDSKYVDGKPVWNEHGKIAKGPNYFRANLAPFVGVDPTI